MQWVSSLPVGEFPYEEYILPFAELDVLKEHDPELYSAYWEVLCHFFICERLKDRSHGGLAHSTWAEYHFSCAGTDQIGMPFVLLESQAQQLATISGVTLK